MQDLIISILERLLSLRDLFWDLDCSQPIWLYLGIRWCFVWLSNHGEDDVDD